MTGKWVTCLMTGPCVDLSDMCRSLLSRMGYDESGGRGMGKHRQVMACFALRICLVHLYLHMYVRMHNRFV